MLRDGYPALHPPHDWARRTERQLPTEPRRTTLAQWESERRDLLTVYQHARPERERKRFSVVWEPADGAARTVWGSSLERTAAHVRRTFERADGRW